MDKILIVAKREYFKMVKSKGFWFATLMLPVLMVVVSIISGMSGQTIENKIAEEAKNAKAIYLLDESGFVDQEILKQTGNIVIAQDFASGENAVKNGVADLFIYYPKDILKTNSIKIISQDKGIMSLGMYDEVAKNLLKQNILAEIKSPDKIALFNAQLGVETQLYKDGEKVSSGFDRFVLPIASVFAYFLFTSVASSYLLLSVSEEKENRMIEIILSVIKPRDLIVGKVLGQMGAILTQILVLVGLGIAILKGSGFVLPIDLSNFTVAPLQLILAFVYLMAGFLVLAFTMVGVGAAMPTYKEANGFASVFIMMSIFPIYFFALILAEPTGPLAIGLSYFPYTAPMILLLRNALGALPWYEVILSIVALALSIMAIAFISYKMFEFGAMEYNQKVSFKEFINTKFKKRK